jgi:predicted permease
VHENNAKAWRWIDDSLHDVRYAFRLLRRAPVFTAVAVSTLALGIGASTTIFSVAYGVSLRPLPYPEPARLVRVHEVHIPDGSKRQDVSVGTFNEVRQRAGTIESAALMEEVRISHLADANEQPVTSLSVSPAFFRTLGVAPMLGPGFRSEEAYRVTRADEVVLSYGAWQRLFGGRPDVVGTSLHFWRDDSRWLVVGVMPRGFAYGPAVDVWRPEIVPARIVPALRNLRQAEVVARLRPGVTLEQVRIELHDIATRLAREFPATNADWTITLEPLQTAFIGDFGRATWLLLAAVVVVFLVACVNVAGLLVARAVGRERETMVREAVGATRWRLVRLWLAEAWLLAAPGTAVGLLLAWAGVRALKAAAPPGIPRLDEIVLDAPVLAVMAICAVTATGVLGLVALRRLEWRRPRRARHALLVLQCAGAAALVVLAVMISRSFTRLVSVDPGWNPAGIISMNILPEIQGRTRDGYVSWADQLLEQLRTKPAIQDAALTTQVPLSTLSYTDVFVRGKRDAGVESPRWSGVRHSVTDGYFALMGVQLLEGRVFDARDRFNLSQLGPDSDNDRGVVIVSERVARTLWPGRTAIGEALWLPTADNVRWREVIGIVEDIQFHAVGEAPGMHIFVPYSQTPVPAVRLLVKRTGDGATVNAEIRQAAQAIAPGTRIDQVASFEDLVSRATSRPRFTARTVAASGVLALILASIGTYGTLSFIVAARTREIAIRMSLGESREAVVRDVLALGLTPVLLGCLVGMVVAAAIARAFASLFHQFEPLDVGSYAAGTTLLLLTSLVAAVAPAMRALRVNPSTSLHVE